MSDTNGKQPKYRHYRPKNLAVVRLDGRDIYLGPFGSPESWERYHRLIAERLAEQQLQAGAPHLAQRVEPQADLTVNQVLNAYRKYAETYYVRNGKPTKELADMKYAARPLRKLYGRTLAREFGPLALKAVREHMIEVEDLSRGVVNARVNRIKRILKWAVSEELVPPSVYEGLRAVAGLRYGRTRARETEPVKPVPWAWVEPVLEHVSRQVAAMIQVQLLCAMRPCEVVMMRACDIDMTGEIWIYEPFDHKNRWRGHRRLIPIGPKAQDLIKPFLQLDTQAYLFSPRQAEMERNSERRKQRKSPMTPSQRRRRPKKRPKRAKRMYYDVASYRRAIKYGIDRANKQRASDEQLPEWYPLQLRHSRATEIRKQYGLEAAQASLGHARADVTQVYAERNLEQALRVAREIG